MRTVEEIKKRTEERKALGIASGMNGAPAANPSTVAAKPDPDVCRFRTAPTGEKALCTSCGGKKVFLHVFGCSVHQRCTVKKQSEDKAVACCHGCKERQEPIAEPAPPG